MAETTPLRHSAQRHTLLHQIHAYANTSRRWTRTRNPRKADPGSGLPDFLYTVADPAHRPSPPLQRAVRELDQHGLLSTSTADADHQDLDVSAVGAQTLAAWNATFGEPDLR